MQFSSGQKVHVDTKNRTFKPEIYLLAGKKNKENRHKTDVTTQARVTLPPSKKHKSGVFTAILYLFSFSAELGAPLESQMLA